MKNLLIILTLLTCLSAFGQEQPNTDSVEVRILNRGKYYIKEHTITLNGTKYQFSDIWPNKYSNFQKLPYIWPNNRTKTTVIVKKMFKYDQWLTTELMPIDHVGERKYENGKLTIELRTKVKSGQLEIEQTVTTEQ